MKWILGMLLALGMGQLQAQSIADKNNQFIGMLKRQAFDSAYAMFNLDLKAKVSQNQLQLIWTQLQIQAGELLKEGEAQVTMHDHYVIVVTPLEMKKSNVNLQLTFEDSTQAIGGIFFLPGKEKEIEWNPPVYVNPSFFDEIDVEFGMDPFMIKGTLTLPHDVKNPPVVVLVHGSGANDRDQTIGPNKILKELAWGLASNGVAVLRYDKRNFLYAGKLDPSTFTLEEETIQDAVAACLFLKTRSDVDTNQVYVAGHSLGGMCAPLIGQRAHTAGIIILAGNSRKLYELLPEQFDYILGLDGITTEDELELKKILEQVNRVRKGNFSTATPDEQMPLNISAAYWLSVKNYDQIAVARQYKGRMLVVHGKRDYQIPMKDFEGWKKGLKAQADYVLFEDLNHLLQPGVGASYPMEYQQVKPVSESLIRTLVSWIKKENGL